METYTFKLINGEDYTLKCLDSFKKTEYCQDNYADDIHEITDYKQFDNILYILIKAKGKGHGDFLIIMLVNLNNDEMIYIDKYSGCRDNYDLHYSPDNKMLCLINNGYHEYWGCFFFNTVKAIELETVDFVNEC